MNAHLKLTLAGVAVAALMAACSPPAEPPAKADKAAAAAPIASLDVYAFRIGALDAYALRDGGFSMPNNGTALAVGEPKADVDALLSAAGLPADRLELSVQPLLVRMGERIVLFDTGNGGGTSGAGKLMGSLRAAGVQPGQVTDILISHGHGDHVGGLVGDGGELAFPNATVRLSANEWNALKADASMTALVTAVTPRVETFAANAEVVPGVRAVDIAGHTAGHSGFEIASGGERLLYIADTMHHPVISVQRPDWTLAFDGVDATAKASRRTLLRRAASGHLRLYAVHFPFPGLGRIERRDDDFIWVPEVTAQP